MKHIYSIATFLLFVCSYAQQDGSVGVGTENPHPSAVLDIVSDNKGFLAPHIALTSKTDKVTILNPADGIMVYNTSTITGNAQTAIAPGLVYWQTNEWKQAKVSTAIEITENDKLISYLGYDSQPFTTDLGKNFTFDNVNFDLNQCINWTQNNHTYCSYTINNGGINWQQAFNTAKEKKGYLVTITNLAEWQFLYDNLIANKLDNSFWIGYNKIDFSGNPTEFAWITGEKTKIDWPTQTTEDYFRAGEPNNAGGNEGCVHVVSKQIAVGDNGRRGWNDFPCGGTNDWEGQPMKHIIIEYNP